MQLQENFEIFALHVPPLHFMILISVVFRSILLSSAQVRLVAPTEYEQRAAHASISTSGGHKTRRMGELWAWMFGRHNTVAVFGPVNWTYIKVYEVRRKYA